MTADDHLRAAADRLARGDRDGAWRACEAALVVQPDCLPAHQTMARIALPGPYYTGVLSAVHARLKPRTYLEIGVASGKTIVLAAPDTRAVGVDPDPKIRHPLGRNVRIVQATSDDFFARQDLAALFGEPRIDLAFIDGMHHFEFALRDFVAVERLAGPGSTVLLHDCYPLDRRTAERVRSTVFWSGDCWRLILALKKHRPDLAVSVIATAPTGLAVVRNLDPASRVLAERMDEVVAEFLAVDYDVLDADKPGMLNVVANDPARIGELLSGT
jgi:Methyltransferase domain